MRLPSKPEATSCFRFNSANTSYVSVNSNIGYSPTTPYSISFWFKTDIVPNAADRSLWSNGNSTSTTQCFNIKLSASGTILQPRIHLFLRDDAASIKLNHTVSTSSYIRGAWNHVVWTDNAGTAKLYINGVLDSTNFNYTPGSGGYTLDRTAIGTLLRTSAGNSFAGGMYDARVYNRILTAQEAQDLADGKDIDTTDLALQWIGNQNGGATVPDASGNGNDGTFTTPFYVRDSPFYSLRSNVGGNLLYNGDFEIYPKNDNVATTTSGRWIDGTASGTSTNTPHAVGWALQYATSGSAMFDTTVKYNGSCSLKLSTTAINSNVEVSPTPANTGIWLFNNAPRAISGQQFTYAFRMKTNYVSGAGAGAYLELVSRNATGGSTGTTTSTKVTTTTDWTYYTGTVTAPAGTYYFVPRMRIEGNSGLATLIMDAWFDDIVVTETTPVSRQTATGRLAVQDMGTSLSFNGTSDKVSIGTAISPTTAITYSAWVKPTTPKANQRIIALFSHSSIRLDTNGRIAFVIHGIVEYFGTTRLNPNTWYHIAATYDRTNVKIYVNGVLESTTAETRAFPSTTTAGWIGTYDGATQFFAGKIDEPIIFNNRALSDTDVGNLYQNGLTRGSTLTSGLVGEWLFDEGSGSTAYDTSGSDNHGTITGATYSTDVACVGRSVA